METVTPTTSSTALSSPPSHFNPKYLKVAIFAGIIARLIIWLCSDGSNDADYFRFMARETARIGQVELYKAKYGIANHPPFSGYYAAAVAKLVGLGAMFPIVLKVPMLLADGMVFVLLWKIWRERRDDEPPHAWPPVRSTGLARIAVAAYACNVVAILVGAYHCNTDIIYAAFALLAIYLIERRNAHFLGGLALAAAMNVKVIPLILVAPLLLQYRSIKPAMKFCAGLAVGMAPFYPFFFIIPHSFWRNVFAYKPVPALWGFQFLLLELKFHNIALPYVLTTIDRYSQEGRWMVMGIMLLIGLIARRREWSRFELACAVMSAFLVTAPGFGVQYCVLIVPMLCAVSPIRAIGFGTIAGVFIGWVYLWYRVPGFPVGSRFTGGIPELPAVVGILAWLTLIAYLFRQLSTKPPARQHTLFPPFPTNREMRLTPTLG